MHNFFALSIQNGSECDSANHDNIVQCGLEHLKVLRTYRLNDEFFASGMYWQGIQIEQIDGKTTECVQAWLLNPAF